MDYKEEKLLAVNNWKIHHKENGKRFFEDPITHHVYLDKHAVEIQYQRNVEKDRAEAELKTMDEGDKYMQWRESGGIYAHSIDEFVKPAKKTKKKSAGKPSSRRRRS